MISNSKPSASDNGTQHLRPTQQIVVAKPVQPGPPVSAGPTLDSGVNSLRRHWKLGIPLGLILAALGGAIGWFLLVPEYSASAYVRVNSDDRPLVFETADAAAGNAANFKLYKNTQAQMILTPYVLYAALREEGIEDLEVFNSTPDKVSWLQENLKIQFPADGEVMQISLEAPLADNCIKIVNAVVKAYINEVVERERNERVERLNNLQSVYSETEGKVRAKREELKKLAEALGTSDAESLTVAQQSALQQFGHMQEKLSTIQFQLMQAEGDLKIFQTLEQQAKTAQQSVATPEPTQPNVAVNVSDADLRTPAVVGLENEVTTLQSRLQSIRETAGSGHPSVRRLVQELELKQQLLEKYKSDALMVAKQRALERAIPSASGRSDSTFASYDFSPLKTLELSSRVEILKNQETILKEKVDMLAAETHQLGTSTIDVELMRAEIQGQEDVLRQIGGEMEKTSIELKTSSRIVPIGKTDRATPPDTKKRLAATIGLGVAGLFAPLALLIGWDLSRRKVDSVEAANKTLAMDSLGSVPLLDYDPLVPSKRCGPRETRQRLEMSESINSLAAMVTHRCQVDDAQVFMVTSAISSEGKSTIACQLAESLSKAGKQVVLIDFDVRRPTIHEYLSLKRSPGVIDLFYKNAGLLDVVQISKLHGMNVITAGEGMANFNELAISRKLEQLLSQLRARYDIVIVDACPVLPVVDARIIGKFVDGVLLTLLRDRSRLPLVAQACQMLKSYGVKLMGTVLIGGQSTSYGGYYYEFPEQKATGRITHRQPNPPKQPK